MATHHGRAVWEGDLKRGNGRMILPDSDISAPYSAPSRFENGDGTSPEALIGGAHAGCFSMALAKMLGEAGYAPSQLQTDADVTIEQTDGGFAITSIALRLRAQVPDIAEDEFGKLAGQAKEGCPVSKLVQGATIALDWDLSS